jgi:hypothetical protein
MSRLPISRHSGMKLPGYRSGPSRFGGPVGASRLSPLARLGPRGACAADPDEARKTPLPRVCGC